LVITNSYIHLIVFSCILLSGAIKMASLCNHSGQSGPFCSKCGGACGQRKFCTECGKQQQTPTDRFCGNCSSPYQQTNGTASSPLPPVVIGGRTRGIVVGSPVPIGYPGPIGVFLPGLQTRCFSPSLSSYDIHNNAGHRVYFRGNGASARAYCVTCNGYV
jgi:hypothetical protein